MTCVISCYFWRWISSVFVDSCVTIHVVAQNVAVNLIYYSKAARLQAHLSCCHQLVVHVINFRLCTHSDFNHQ